MENEVKNLYFATKDLEEYYKLKKCILNMLNGIEIDHKQKKYVRDYIKMMFNSYEKRIFCVTQK